MRLFCEKGPLQGARFELDEAKVYRLGREPGLLEDEAYHSEAIRLPSPSVSKSHCELFFDSDSGAWSIRDLQSFNGIRINKVKALEASLHLGDRLDVGEFRFRLEEAELEPTAHQAYDEGNDQSFDQVSDSDFQSSDQGGSVKARPHLFKLIQGSWERFDYRYKFFGLLALAAVLIQWAIFTPLLRETEKNVFRQSIRVSSEQAKRLAKVNESMLSARQVHLLDCRVLTQADGVFRSYILDERGQVLCPLGEVLGDNLLVSQAIQSQSFLNSCEFNPAVPQDTCTVVVPIRAQDVEESNARVTGYAVTIYVPLEVFEVSEKFKDLRFQTLFISLLIVLSIAFGLYFWLRRGLKALTGDVHLLYTGTAQNVESPQSFAVLEPLSEEINRLFTKINQGLNSDSQESAAGAGFLQQVLDQVFLLEDRALMAVDADNHLIAVSDYLPEIVPLHENSIGAHVTDSIADTHLQSDLMTFLNEVSSGREVLDKALSTTDRVLQSRALPLWVRDEYIGSIVIF